MTDENDLNDFMAVAGTKANPNQHPRSVGEPLATPASEDPGKLCQYRMNGTAFVPTTPSKPALAPGIYSVDWVEPFGIIYQPKNIVTDDLLRLPDSKSDRVIEEIEKFWTLKEIMNKLKFVHKRGFLLWGPPGSGKTSTVAVVMRQMVKNGGVVFLGNTYPWRLASALSKFREIEPSRPLMVVYEDLDGIIEEHGEQETLSTLDGEGSVDNVVFMATTNYPEKLDGRVVNRPSRFDRVVKIGMPNIEARRMYLESKGLIPKRAKEWSEITENFSIAHLKEMIIGVDVFGESVENVLTRLRGMGKKPSSEEEKKSLGFSK